MSYPVFSSDARALTSVVKNTPYCRDIIANPYTKFFPVSVYVNARIHQFIDENNFDSQNRNSKLKLGIETRN